MRPFEKSRSPKAATSVVRLFAALWLGSATFAPPVQADAIRVLLIGDSLSTGGDEFVSGDEPGLSYADQLELDLGDAYEFVNVACPGSSALDWSLSTPGILCNPYPWWEIPNGLLKELALPELPVDIVTVLLGTNDAVGFFEPQPVTAEAYGQALDELVGELLAGGAGRIVLMTPPDLVGTEAHDLLEAYREEIFDRCHPSEDLVCGPDFFTLLDLELDFAGGDVHPNARGHAQMAEALGTSILEIPEPGTIQLSIAALATLAMLAARP